MLTVGGLFDGCGLLAYGLHRAGLRHAWLCEVDDFRRELLELRFPGIPVIPDVRDVGADVVPRVDVIAGGFPCKGASVAGRRTGFGHPETVLWREMARAVRELRPRYVLVENVVHILRLGDGAVWGEVVGDLAALGFSVTWDCLPAEAFGAPHIRDRVFAIAVAEGRADEGVPQAPDRAALAAHADGVRRPDEGRRGTLEREKRAVGADAEGRGLRIEWDRYEPAIRRWERIHAPAPEPLVRRVDDGRAWRLERSRLSALGDGVLVQAGELCGRWIMNHALAAARDVAA